MTRKIIPKILAEDGENKGLVGKVLNTCLEKPQSETMNKLDTIEAKNETLRSFAALNAIIKTCDNHPTIDRILESLQSVLENARAKKIDLIRFPRKTVD